MSNESNKNVIWTVAIGIIVLLAIGAMYVSNNAQIKEVKDLAKESNDKVDSAVANVNSAVTALQNTPQATVNVPTAKEIAAEIDLPDTDYSVRADKKSLAISLASDEFNTRDFKSELVTELNSELELSYPNKLVRSDISSVSIRDTETSVSWYGTTANVDFVIKVVFDYYGDDETAKVRVHCHATDLDYDNDYEDADVTCSLPVNPVISTSLD
jgi:hypothetical protein